MSEIAEPSSLWLFAVRTYALQGVAEICLHLQDEHGLDVDIVLATLWLASRGVEVDAPLLMRILQAAAPARARVLEIRTLRRAVGSDRDADPRWEATYANVKAAELEAERVELMAIEAAATLASSRSDTNPVTLARRGLRRYAAHEHRTAPDALLDDLVDRTITGSGSQETIGFVPPS